MSDQSVRESRGSYLADAAKELVVAASESSFDAATFFEKFELLTDIPNVIGRLRNVFLTLAVSGQLVPQFPSEGDSSESLSHARDERKKLVSSGSIKRRAIASVEDTETPFAIPASWRWARLVDVGHELGQKTPSDVFTYIDVGGIDSFPGRVSDRVEILEASEAPSRARKVVKRGTVIYSTVRPYLLNVAIVERDYVPEPIASTAFGILHPFSVALSKYLFYWLRSPAFTAYVEAGMKGMAYPAINDEKFYAGLIPLPPLSEQKRIVAKVDELMGLCDRLEALEAERKDRHASLSRAALARFAAAPTPTNLQFLFHNSFDVEPGDIRQSILALAIRGKLVSQQSEDKPLEPEVTLDTQQAFDISKNWVWTNLKGIGTCHTGKTPPTNNPLNYGLGFPFIGPGQITPTGKLITSEKMLTKAGLENTTIGNPGDILMVCIGGSIGKAVACQETIGFNQQINSIRVSKSLPEFILLVLVSSYFQNEVVSRASGSATPIINKGKWEQIPIPIPPLAEQKRIVAKVDELMALVDQLEQQLANSRTLGQQLLEAVVERLTNSTAQTETMA